MASGSTPHNRSSSATTPQGQVLRSIGENATNVRIPQTRRRSLQITKIDELEPSLTYSAWTIHASVTKKRGQVPFLLRENDQYTEVYLRDVKTGMQIRAVAFAEYAEKFDRLLQKDQAYLISRGSIKPARRGIPTEHNYEIRFNRYFTVEAGKCAVSGPSTEDCRRAKPRIKPEVRALIREHAGSTGPKIQDKLLEAGVQKPPALSTIYRIRSEPQTEAMTPESGEDESSKLGGAASGHRTRSSSGESSRSKRVKASTQEAAEALLHISSEPTAKHLNELIVCQIASKWKKVAVMLGVETFIIENVSVNNPKDCEGACQDVLERWLRGERHTGERDRTWSTLLMTLESAGYKWLVGNLRKKRFQDGPTSQ